MVNDLLQCGGLGMPPETINIEDKDIVDFEGAYEVSSDFLEKFNPDKIAKDISIDIKINVPKRG